MSGRCTARSSLIPMSKLLPFSCGLVTDIICVTGVPPILVPGFVFSMSMATIGVWAALFHNSVEPSYSERLSILPVVGDSFTPSSILHPTPSLNRSLTITKLPFIRPELNSEFAIVAIFESLDVSSVFFTFCCGVVRVSRRSSSAIKRILPKAKVLIGFLQNIIYGIFYS